MTIQAVLGLAVAMVIFVASPGPGVFAVIARALSHGFFASFSFILGVVLGDFSYLAFAILGLSAIAKSFAAVFFVIKIVGGLYLIYLGLSAWRKPVEEQNLENQRTSNRQGFVAGLLLTLANPKVILFYLGFLPSFVDLQNMNFQIAALVMLVIASVIIVVMSTYAFFASRFSKAFTNKKTKRRLNQTSAVVLALAGVLVILKK